MLSFKNTISYIQPVVMKYKFQFFFIFVLHAIRIILSSVIIPLFYKRIIDVISQTGADKVSLSHSLYQNIFLITAIMPIAWFFGRSTQYLVSKFQSSVIRDLHDFSFKKLQGHSYSFFADNFSGSLVSKSRKFVRAFEAMHDILIDKFYSSLVLFTAIFIVFFIQARLIAFIFLGMSVFYLLIVFMMSAKKVKYDIEEAVADSKVTGYIADSITNVLSIKSSSALDREVEGFKKVTATEAGLRLRAWIFGNKINAIQSAITMIVQILVAFLTGYLWLSGKISAGIFLLVQSYSVTISNNFWDLGQATSKFTRYMSEMKEMVDIFKQVPDVLDISHPEKSKIKDGNIEIKNIFFSYLHSSDIFINFSLKIKAGEKVGIVGHSGGGKSTITKLLMRFVDISEGVILIDGQDIGKITQDDLRRSISYISQEPVLFHRSVRDNIAYSKPEAGNGEIIAVAKKAHANEFILKLPYGYDTKVGERGVKLSGGERQRVAIARAMLKDAPILILDEATSSLDSISEHYIQDAFNELMKGKTTIVIAHRLSTIQKMDRIIVLDNGKIVEEGNHKELLEKKGFYANLWEHQTGGFLD
ncbi:MAG: ABC transporter ATP-binding protein [Patescibacteria group bacterium]